MDSGKKRSLFYQRMKKKNSNSCKVTDFLDELEDDGCISSSDTNCSSYVQSDDKCVFGERSYIIKGDDADRIHQENVCLLSTMSDSEINDIQQKLLGTISPANLNFLKRNRMCQAVHNENLHTPDMVKENNLNKIVLENSDNLTKLNSEKESTEESVPPVVQELYDRGLHMDVYEPEKVKWLTDIPKLETVLPPKLYEARFDFNGDLMPYVETNAVTYRKGLHNHGDEPHRPGYSIQELYYLIRSSFPMQAVTALNTLAAILEKEHILSLCLETPLLKNLLDSGLYFILRFSLDENQRQVYVAALRAMASLFWNSVDMDFLMESAAIYSDFKLPSFDVVIDSETDENDMEQMKDIELIRVDLVKAALRTDILKRFRYLLRDPSVEMTDLYRILKCLTRIVCHSYDSTRQIIDTDGLLEGLFDRYFNKNDVFIDDGKYGGRLLTLIWLISCRSIDFASRLTNEFAELVPFVLDAIVADTPTKSFVAIQCTRLWRTFLNYGLIEQTVSELSPTLYRLLQSISVDAVSRKSVSYANSVVVLMIFLFDRYESFVSYLKIAVVEQICNRWIAIFINDDLPCDERLFVIFLSNVVRLLSMIVDEKSFDIVERLFVRLSKHRLMLVCSLTKCSFLLKAVCTIEKSTEFPSLRVPITILKLPNYRYLLHSCLKVIIGVRNEYLSNDNSNAFSLLLKDIWNGYVVKIISRPDLHRVANLWPAKFEISFLHDLILASRSIIAYDDIYRATFLLTSLIHYDDRRLLIDLFREILFDRSYFFCDYELDAVRDYYVERFGLSSIATKSTNESSLTSSRLGTDYALPLNWYYVPILTLLDGRRRNENDQRENRINVLKPVLEWILLLEKQSYPNVNTIPFVARYCFLASVFFYENLFLDLTDLLNNILKATLNNVVFINFDESVPGVSRFCDFYSELCSEFGNASYGDPTFGMFLLVPLQQIYSSEFRKLVWLEHVHVPRFLTTRHDQLLIPLKNYLEPCETDRRILFAYLENLQTGMVTKNRSPVLYDIALCHVSTFIADYTTEYKLARVMKKLVTNLGNLELKDAILNYRRN